MFDTLTLIDAIWPELRTQIITKNINVKTYFNNVPKNVPKKNFTRNNRAKNNPARNNPAQNKETYPFGASATRRRRRIRS